jgi:hypothetical protein
MLSTANPPAEDGLAHLSVEERRALLDRMAASAQFRRSARLRDFLLYVGTQSLKEGCPEIHEQEIGMRVFGRSPSYDTSQDNIVRVNATELRKRIEQYFTTEGADETLVLEIPRGAYRPLFHRRSALERQPLAPGSHRSSLIAVTGAPTVLPPQRRSLRAHPIWAVACIALAALCAYQYQQNRTDKAALTAWNGKPALASFWGDFLRYRQQTDVVLTDDSLSFIVDLIGHPVSLGDYLSRDYMRQVQASNLSADRKYDLQQVYSHNLVTFGGVRASQEILAQIPPSLPTHLTLARYYTADALKRNNAILIGGRKANPWVHLFDDRMNFVTDFGNGRAFVSNLHPRAGEQAVYNVSYDPNALAGYSVVAYFPTPSGNGNAIILAGTDSDATDAAAEFLMSEEQMEHFRGLLHAKTFPYFEILLKTSRLSGTSFNSEILAYRTYPSLH